jgi:hypothetical protein
MHGATVQKKDTFCFLPQSFYVLKGYNNNMWRFSGFVSMNWDKYKKHKKLRNTSSYISFNN